MGKLIGIFGGSFDPIHNGHLNLATEIMEAHHLDEVWFCPAAISPHKMNQIPVSVSHRVNMVQLAIQEEPRFLVSDIEINRKGPSYTIDALNELFALQENAENINSFALILGEDAARSFSKWHKPESIVQMVKLLIGARDTKKDEIFHGSEEVVKAIYEGLTPTRIMEISSKEIRDRLLNKKYCYHLLPAKVMDYITTHQLYYTSLNRFL